MVNDSLEQSLLESEHTRDFLEFLWKGGIELTATSEGNTLDKWNKEQTCDNNVAHQLIHCQVLSIFEISSADCSRLTSVKHYQKTRCVLTKA